MISNIERTSRLRATKGFFLVMPEEFRKALAVAWLALGVTNTYGATYNSISLPYTEYKPNLAASEKAEDNFIDKIPLPFPRVISFNMNNQTNSCYHIGAYLLNPQQHESRVIT